MLYNRNFTCSEGDNNYYDNYVEIIVGMHRVASLTLFTKSAHATSTPATYHSTVGK